MKNKYLLQTERLGLRPWRDEDLNELIQLNADPQVMQHFPSTLSEKESAAMLIRLKDHYKNYNYTYFATEILASGELIGFIGLAYKDYEAPFTPATDLGWRLKASAWGKGYASEGAKKCIEYAFNNLNIKRLVSTCPIVNSVSEKVMQKIGMHKQGEFFHPLLKEHSRLEKCLWYEIKNLEV